MPKIAKNKTWKPCMIRHGHEYALTITFKLNEELKNL